MAAKHQKQFVEFLLENGYVLSRSSKSADVYKRPGGTTRLSMIRLVPNIREKDVVNFIHNISRELGIETPRDNRKRNPEQIRERHAQERAAVQAQMDAAREELQELVAAKERADREALAVRERDPIADASLGPVSQYLTRDEVEDIITRIEAKQAQVLAWQKELANPQWRESA
jgi:hypothetical protein